MEETIYVALLDEGVDVWRPVTAVRVSAGTYQIQDSVPSDEEWEFQPLDVVRCEQRTLSGGQVLVAIARL